MHNLIAALILLVAVVSGTSKPLLLLAGILVISFSIGRLPFSNFIVRINHVSVVRASIFFVLLALTIFMMPLENISKFAMIISSNILAVLIIGNIGTQSASSQVRVYALVLGIILLGDLIHLSGVFGSDMNVYKSLVQFDELSNLERESDVGFLGLRYHGWFAEPSYHGAFTGLLCALIWNNGVRKKVFFVAIALFILCPTPMMVLAFGVSALLGGRNWLPTIARHPFATTLGFGIAVISVALLFASRFASLSTGAIDAMGGESVNSSEAIRLVYPVIALLTHFASYGFLPESSSCIERASCLPESLKFPLITYLIFFGITGLISIAMFIGWLYRSNAMRVFVAITVASILSGGGGYILQFALIVAMLLGMSTYKRADTTVAARFQIA